MSAKLVAEEGLLKGLVLSLDEGDQWVIGRDPDGCQLLVEDPAASRKHLICRVTPEGILIENLSHTNPVQVNDEEIDQPRLLHNGDAVRIGSGMFRFYEGEEAKLIQELQVPTPTSEKEKEPLIHDHTDEQELEESMTESKDIPTPINGKKMEEDDDDSIFEEQNLEPDSSPAKESQEESSSQEEKEEESLKEESLEENVRVPQELPQEPEQPVEESASSSQEQTDEQSPANLASPEVSAEEQNPPETPPIPEQNPMPEEQTSLLNPLSYTEEKERPSRSSIFHDQDPDLHEDLLAEINFDMVDTGRWLLKVVGGPNNGAEFSMQAGSSYLIGTDPNTCDIILHDNSVSRQHARLTIHEDETLSIEDLKSRNGTIVDGEALHGSRTLPTNTMVTIGTTTFLVFDREGEMQTIIAPLLPSIVKVLQKEGAPSEQEAQEPPVALASEPEPIAQEFASAEKAHTALGALILIGTLVGLFVIVGIGMTMLFKNEPVQVTENVDATKLLSDALAPFPTIKWSFNKSTGRLLLVGHVLTASDKNQLMYNLQGFRFLKHIDDSGIVIDEYVWREFNQVIEKNPQWRGITLYSPTPGHFVITGNLQTKAQGEKLNEYLSNNFPYLDLLDRRVIVEEEVINSVNAALQNLGLGNITVQLNGGDLNLVGSVPAPKMKDFDATVAEFKQIPGIRNVRNMVTQQAPEASVINVSDKYEVSGYSQSGNSVNVIINGRIVTVGDTLDGMTITSIKSSTIMLEKGTTKYRIDFSR